MGADEMVSSAPRRIHHIDLVVRDLDRAEAQFRKVLGVDPEPREALPDRGVVLARFRIGETWLILVQPVRDDSPVAAFLEQNGEGFFHIAIEVGDVEARVKDLIGAGIEVMNETPRLGVEGWKLIDIEVDQTHGAMIQMIEEV